MPDITVARYAANQGSRRFAGPVARQHRRVACATLACCLGLLFWANHLHAHEPGLSTADIQWRSDRIDIVLTFSVVDMDNVFALDNDGDGKVSQLEFSYAKNRLGSAAAGLVELQLDGQKLSAAEPTIQMDAQNNIEFLMRFAAQPASNLTYRCLLFSKLPRNHRHFVSVKDAGAKLLGERLLNADADTFNEPVSGASAETGTAAVPQQNTFLSFLFLGIEHILTGYDHLLFLFALLLVTREFISALKIITCFTIAHSITLAVATFDLVNIPSRIVEPLIAATIVYVAIENIILRAEPKGRWLLTFSFGLIHGFGFASVLREMNIGAARGGIAVPLVSFNLGVEVGQITVAVILLPLIWKFSKSPVFITRWIPACSAVVALAGGFWLVQRVFGF